jgi:putative lipoic acid-binding regulatory protein
MTEETLLEFPCAFPIKAMGRNEDDFETLVTTLVFRHAAPVPGEAVKVNESGEGNFVSVTVTVEATSKEQLDRIYHDLTDCDRVLMAL